MGANDAAAKSNALAATAEQLPWQHRKNILFRLNGTPGSPTPCSSGPQLQGTSQPLLHWHCSIGWAFTERGMTALLRRELLNMEASDDTPEFCSVVAGIICHSDVASQIVLHDAVSEILDDYSENDIARPTSGAYLASVTT